MKLPKTDKQWCRRNLVTDAVLLYIVWAWYVIELFTKSCVRPVVDSLARRRRTYEEARCDTFESCFDRVQCLVGRRHPARKFTVVRSHPTIIVHFQRPPRVGRQHEEVENAQKMHVHLTKVLLGEWANCSQQY